MLMGTTPPDSAEINKTAVFHRLIFWLVMKQKYTIIFLIRINFPRKIFYV